MIWLALWMGAAFAGTSDDCLNDDSYPLAGTAGYRTGLEALRINAATYNATAFAERSLFPTARAALAQHSPPPPAETGAAPVRPKRPWQLGGAIVYEANQHYGVARVPVWQVGADCPADSRIADRPLDLTSANLGAAARYGRVGAFFSAAVIYGNLAESKPSTRYGLSVLTPMIATVALSTTPFTGNAQVVQGSTAWATDFIGGVSADLEVLEVRAGYAASKGWYLSAAEDRVGLFGNTVARDGLTSFDQFALGARRVRWGDLSDQGLGRTTLFGRQIPTSDTTTAPTETALPLTSQLRTGHVAQDDIAGVVDIAFAYAVAPDPALYDVELAVHSAGFADVGQTNGWRLGGGMVQLPERRWYDQPGGRYVSARAEVLSALRAQGEEVGQVSFSVRFNDEEQLAVFPFATNAVSWRLNLTGRL